MNKYQALSACTSSISHSGAEEPGNEARCYQVSFSSVLVQSNSANHPLLPVLSRASAHGRSQLKPEKSGVGPYTEEVLE